MSTTRTSKPPVVEAVDVVYLQSAVIDAFFGLADVIVTVIA